MKSSTIDAFVGDSPLVFDHNRHPTPPINEGKMANHIRFKGRSLPVIMRFLTIAMSLCVGLALGQDAQLGPAAASVATDAPVLRHPAGGDGDAVRPELGPAPETALSSTASVDSKVKDKNPPSIISMIAGYLSQSDTNNSLPQLAQEVESDGHHLDGSDTDGPSTKSPDTKMVMPAETKIMSKHRNCHDEVSHLRGGSEELEDHSWERCAGEGGTCYCRGIVKYRAKGGAYTYYEEKVYGSIRCSNSIFGDPWPGQVKACYCYFYKFKGNLGARCDHNEDCISGYCKFVSLDWREWWKAPTTRNTCQWI